MTTTVFPANIRAGGGFCVILPPFQPRTSPFPPPKTAACPAPTEVTAMTDAPDLERILRQRRARAERWRRHEEWIDGDLSVHDLLKDTCTCLEKLTENADFINAADPTTRRRVKAALSILQRTSNRLNWEERKAMGGPCCCLADEEEIKELSLKCCGQKEPCC